MIELENVNIVESGLLVFLIGIVIRNTRCIGRIEALVSGKKK